jgi:hypothetical protein
MDYNLLSLIDCHASYWSLGAILPETEHRQLDHLLLLVQPPYMQLLF